MLLKRTVLILIAIALVGLILLPTGAVCATPPLEPIKSAGHIIFSDSVVIEKEKFVFDIPHYDKGTLSAIYSLYNPGESTEIMGVYPLWQDNLQDISVRANGTKIDTHLRYIYCDMYCDDYYFYNLNKYGLKIQDNFVSDLFYSPDQLVTKYIYELSNVITGDTTLYASFKIGDMYSNRFVAEQGYYQIENDSVVYIIEDVWRYSNGTLTFYVIGEDVKEEPEFKFVDDYGKNQIDGVVTLKSKDEMTFSELVLLNRDEEISEVDWYNAVIDCINKKNDIAFYIEDFYVGDLLMPCVSYRLKLGENERVENEVVMPVLPKGIYSEYYKGRYIYEFYVAFAVEHGVKEIEIDVKTPYHLVKAPPFEYDKANDVYIIQDPTLEQVRFDLSGASVLITRGSVYIFGFFGRVIALPIIFALVYGIDNLIRKKRNNSRRKII